MSSDETGASKGRGKPSGPGSRPGAGQPPDTEATRVVRNGVTPPEDLEATAIVRSPDPAPEPDVDPDPTVIVRSPEPKPASATPQPASPQPPSMPPAMPISDLVPDPDATVVVRSPHLDSDATRPLAGADNSPTHVIRPPAPEPPVPTWRGSADVRAGDHNDADNTWTWNTQSSGRAWWLPILLGVVGLLILFGVAFALVHALDNGNTPAPTTTLPPSATATKAPATPSTVPSAAPSLPPTTPPSTPPSPVAPSTPATAASVIVPTTLVGLLSPDAEAALNSLGLKYKLQPQVDNDTSLIPNTVLSVSPAGGTAVAPGSTVTIVYSVLPPSPSASVTTTGP